jgi:hypothetical protein
VSIVFATAIEIMKGARTLVKTIFLYFKGSSGGGSWRRSLKLSHPIRCFTILTDNGIHSSIESASTAALGGGVR